MAKCQIFLEIIYTTVSLLIIIWVTLRWVWVKIALHFTCHKSQKVHVHTAEMTPEYSYTFIRAPEHHFKCNLDGLYTLDTLAPMTCPDVPSMGNILLFALQS